MQEIYEDCGKALADCACKSSEQSTLAKSFVKQLARFDYGYEALLLPLTCSPETPRSDVLFQQCLLALSAPRVRRQCPDAWCRTAAWYHCLKSASKSQTSEALLSNVPLAAIA